MKLASLVPPSTDPPAPVRIPGYDVFQVIGHGALSTVYRVRRTSAAPDEPDYALKLVDAGLTGSQEFMASFRREAAWLASVGHPGLPVIHEIGECDGNPYLVMDLIGGTPLSRLLAAGTVSADRLVALAHDVVGPLSAVHRRGLVHRDIKPDNIMVTPTGEARLIDFGLATRESGEHAEAVMGTLIYTPPEQSGMLRRPVDHRCDLYSLGAVLFECLAGTPPFHATDVNELLRQHAVTPAPDLVDLVPGIPVRLAALVARLLAKDPDDRYQSGEELAADLHQLGQGSDRPAPGASAPSRERAGDVALAGRTRELGRLREQWQQALAGTGRACLVRAAGGTGKTRLAAELAGSARRAGSPVLHAKSSTDDPVPMAALRTAFEGYLTELDRLPRDLRDRAREMLVACAGPGAHLLAGLTPGLADLLGVEPARAPAAQGAAGRDRFVVAIVDLLAAMARACGGLLIVLDDVQWLDQGSAAVIRRLADRLGDLPLMVLATARDDDTNLGATRSFAGSLGAALTLELALAPLDDQGVGELIAVLLPGVGTDESLTRLIAARAGGNPFVIQEYVRAIVDAGLLRPSWGTWLLDESGLGALELPQDALGLVLNRVENLGEQIRAVLGTAAALGTRFRPAVVAAVHGLALEVVQAALVEAAGRGLVEPRGKSHYAFVHDRIREALTEQQSAQAVADLHLTIAETLSGMPDPAGGHDAEHLYAIARHFVNARLDQPGACSVARSQAFAACWAAGQLALEAYAAADAVPFLLHAALLQPDAHAAGNRFLICLGTALNRDFKQVEAVQVLDQALATEKDRATRAEILGLVADAQRSLWAVDEAKAAIEQGLAELGVRPPRRAVWKLLSCLPMLLAAHLMVVSGYRWRAARGAQRLRCELIAHLHEVGAYLAVIQQEDTELLMHSVRAVYWVNRLGGGPGFARAHGAFAFVLTMLGLRRAARGAWARAEADESMSDPAVLALIGHFRGVAALLSYEDNGQEWARTTLEHGRWLDVGAYSDAAYLICAEALDRGRTAQTALWFDLAARRSLLHGTRLPTVDILEAQVLAAAGQPSQAAAKLEQARGQITTASPAGLVQAAHRAEIFLLSEQEEYGPPLERAITAYEALGLDPKKVMRPARAPLFAIAMARLAQCRLPGADRAQALSRARKAVSQLGIAPRCDVQRAHNRIARADLLIIEGHPWRALEVLDGLDPVFEPDAPLVVYEAARVRARALVVIGGTEAAARQAGVAQRIAEDNGWPHRAASVAAEFTATDGRRASGWGGSIAPGPTAGAATRAVTTGPGAGGWDPARLAQERLRTLERIGATAARVFDPEELARLTLDEAIRILTAERAFLFLADDNGDLVPHLGRDSAGDDLTELTGYSASLVQKVHLDGELLVVTGTEHGAALGAHSVVLHGLRSIMVAPLQIDGRRLGVIYLDSHVAKGIFTSEDVGILTALTQHIAISWETARAARLEISVQSAQRQRELAEALREALEGMTTTLDPQDVLARLVDSAATLLRCSGGWLLTAEQAQPLPLTGPAVTGNEALVPVALAAELSSAASWIAVPLCTTDTTVGVLVLAADGAGGQLAEQIDVAAALASQGVTAYERATLFAQVQRLAVQDELTGLANRRQFFAVAERDLSSATRHGRPVCALMIDIDHFKAVNDTYGHPTGDDVIRVVAERLQQQVRNPDVVGRYGGEEFAVVLPDMESGAELANRLLASVADTPVPTRSGPLDVTISIGHARLAPGPEGVAELLARADQALYVAKREGRNRAVRA